MFSSDFCTMTIGLTQGVFDFLRIPNSIILSKFSFNFSWNFSGTLYGLHVIGISVVVIIVGAVIVQRPKSKSFLANTSEFLIRHLANLSNGIPSRSVFIGPNPGIILKSPFSFDEGAGLADFRHSKFRLLSNCPVSKSKYKGITAYYHIIVLLNIIFD